MEIIPGVFEKDAVILAHKVGLVATHTEWVQIDIADNTFVPVESVHDPLVLAKIIKDNPGPKYEAHMMVSAPEKYIKSFVDAGFSRLIAHVEAYDPRLFLEEVRYESVEVGLAIDANTQLDEIEPLLEEIDVVLVMTSEAGASGQKFMPETVEKIKAIHESYPDLPIEVDCGMNPQTIKIVEDAGASRAAVTSYIFNDEPRAAARIRELSKI
jgi:ribulose-phosphate 3-epimerase